MTKTELLEKLETAIPDVKDMGSGVAQWDNLTFKLTLTGREIDEITSSLKAMEGKDVSDEVRDYFDLIYDNIPVSVDNCILPDHAREELANILNAAMRDNLIKKI